MALATGSAGLVRQGLVLEESPDLVCCVNDGLPCKVNGADVGDRDSARAIRTAACIIHGTTQTGPIPVSVPCGPQVTPSIPRGSGHAIDNVWHF